MDSEYPVLPAPATPTRRPPKRSNQPAGEHFDSPQRRRRWRTDSELVLRPELPLREEQLSAELEGLFRTYDKSRRHDDDSEPPSLINHDEDVVMESSSEPPGLERPIQDPSNDLPSLDSQSASKTRRVVPDETTHRLYANWLALIPTLVSDYLGYMQQTQGRLGRSPGIHAYQCPKGLCTLEKCEVLCLHFDCMLSRLVHSLLLISGSRLEKDRVSDLQLHSPPANPRPQWPFSYSPPSASHGCLDRSARPLLCSL